MIASATTSMKSVQYYVVVPAAGVGRRMGADVPKQYLTLNGKLVIEHTLAKFLLTPQICRIVVAVSETDNVWRSLPIFENPKIDVVIGGTERSDSVYSGLQYLGDYCERDDWVLVHDVARPCISLTDIERLMSDLAGDAVGGILALPCSDTIKQVDDSAKICATLDRSTLWQAQTPQMFRFSVLRDALQGAIAKGQKITDEASAIELAGLTPRVIEGARSNIKITQPEDLELAAYYLGEP